MSRRVTLYVGGLLADLPETSPVLFNWVREELDNPTIVRNSYTHQLTLPATERNNAIFGHFDRLDRRTTPQVGVTTGISFNPLKKLDFALYDERMEVLARGYLKLDSIARRGRQASSYGCTLYGGLGSLFYDLAYAADGSERTLADLIYKDGNDADVDPANTTLPLTAATVAALWGAGGSVPDWSNVLTFAPAYNGLPEGDFDANKALVTSAGAYNFPAPLTDDGTSYKPYTTGGAILAIMQNKHAEWEMQDFRAYLQRPVVSVKAVLQALTDARNGGDWSLTLSGTFFSSGTNAWYDDAWMTLPLVSLPDGGSWATLTLADALRGTCSPAAFLVAYAKMFGLVFDVDESRRAVTLMTRDDYYAAQPTHDITFRIDSRSIDVVPVNASARWYELAAAASGEYVEQYAKTYGRTYGSQRIDTGWEFDDRVNALLGEFPFKGAADVLEASTLYRLDVTYRSGYLEWFPACSNETVKYRLYSTENDATAPYKDFDARTSGYSYRNTAFYNNTYNGYDAFPKVQLHGSGNKAQDGSGVLLVRSGSAALPTPPNGVASRWHVSNDTAAMSTLNEGKPCWICYNASTADIKPLSALPVYRRMAGALTMDFGAPREIAVPGETTGEGASVYYNRWRNYLVDRYYVDTKVMTARVDLRGWRPGTSLMRRFFWYGGSLWSLNRIKDYAPTLDALTVCEFVQVQDKSAYTASQSVPGVSNYYLIPSPSSITVDPSGGTYTVTVTSNVAWTLVAPGWVTASALSGNGNSTVTLTVGSNAGAARSGSLAFSGAHSTSGSVSLSQATDFTPQISINRPTYSVQSSAYLLYFQITCNGAWSCTGSTDPSWLTCSSSGNGNGTATIGVKANSGAQRTATLTFAMTDYPGVTCTSTITQAAYVPQTTYRLELGAASYAFAPTGGSYTLVAEGVTLTDGVETDRVSLSASDLSFSKTGSSAISRSGLVFSAADLGLANTAQQSATYTVTWNANGEQASFVATQQANVVVWSLDLSKSSHTFAASGGSYTLGVEGVTTRNGSEVARVTLAASALTFSQSGSNAITRSGLDFSAASLGAQSSSQQQTAFGIVWAANPSATATFTATQEANTYSVMGETIIDNRTSIPDPIIWDVSGTATAAHAGDAVTLDPTVNVTIRQQRLWTSGVTNTVVVNAYLPGTLSVDGVGLSLDGNELQWAANAGAERSGTVTLTLFDWSKTWNLTQDHPAPIGLQIAHDGYGMLSFGAPAEVSGVYRWQKYVSGVGTVTVYTSLNPDRGYPVYSGIDLTDEVGRVTEVTYP